MLSSVDFKIAIAEGHLKIYPFEEKNLTGVGYNLSTTNFAFSINRQEFLTISKYESETTAENRIHGEYFHRVTISPNDTILFFSREYIKIDGTLAGTFHTKVSRACEGLGHISTTLDPTWEGQLIIAVNNPTSRTIEFDLDEKSGNIMTLVLHELKTPLIEGKTVREEEPLNDNQVSRCDLILPYFKNKNSNFHEFLKTKFTKSLNAKEEGEEKEYLAKDKYDDLERLKKYIDDVIDGNEKIEFGSDGRKILSQNNIKTLKECFEFKVHDDLNKRAIEWYYRNDNDGEVLKDDSFKKRRNHWKECFNPDHIWKSASDYDDNDCVKLPDVFDVYSEIVEHEIECRKHKKRIEWQNERIYSYASEEESKRAKRQKLIKFKSFFRFAFCCFLFIIPLILFALILKFGLPENISEDFAIAGLTILTTICLSVEAIIIKRGK